jgi:hypothetical protein
VLAAFQALSLGMTEQHQTQHRRYPLRERSHDAEVDTGVVAFR